MMKCAGKIGIVLSLLTALIVGIPNSAQAAYAFTSHTFTTCGQTGVSGPSQATCRSAYSTTWDESDTNFTVTGGIQIWTVPYTGLYRINAYGAAGSGGAGQYGTSTGGNGAQVQGDFSLTEGDKIRILVGQQGSNTGATTGDGAAGSGGGGTFVIKGTSGANDVDVLVIAAGGNGGNDPGYISTPANGLGGLYTSSGTGDGANNGGSFRGTAPTYGGASFASGGAGGTYARGGEYGYGGFGGGGSTDDSTTGGGGWVGGTTSTAAYSKNNGANQSGASAVNSGAGYVTITSLGPSVTSFAAITSLTNSTSISFNLEISQAVTGIDATDFVAAGTGASTCVIGTVTGSGTSYVIPLTGCSQGSVYLTMTANTATNSSSQTGPSSNTATNTVIVDLTAPTITSAIPVNGTYSATGTSALNITVVFSESVTVTGTPRIPITIGTTSRFANYVSMTDSKTATFRFTVTVDYSDIDLDGIAVNSPLDPNSGTIADLATNAMSTFSFTPPSSTTAYVYQPPSAPTIDSITANNTTLTVYFTAGAANGSTVSNYQFSINNGGSFSVLSPTDAVSPITITGLTNGTTYQVVIKAISNLGVGLASNMVASAPTASASVSISLTASATTANKGTPITITAQVNQAGVITFFWNGERIPGCIKKPATTSATCIWKPAVTGQWSINALLDPTDPTYVDSYSPKLPVFILRRSGTR
jgi:hypothetical protein